MQFNGTLPELKQLLQELEVPCHWEHKGAFEVAVIDDGVSNLKLNWWPGTGVLQLVGDPEQRLPLIEKLEPRLSARQAES
ncbi:MAG: hypothetical protein ACOVNL_05870 [Prochlorococcaceae cyanobacterium]|jgi:hypothetical protein